MNWQSGASVYVEGEIKALLDFMEHIHKDWRMEAAGLCCSGPFFKCVRLTAVWALLTIPSVLPHVICVQSVLSSQTFSKQLTSLLLHGRRQCWYTHDKTSGV